MHKYTYANSGESSCGITFEKLSDLIMYIEEVVTDTFGFVFQDDTIIMKYKVKRDGITWLPIEKVE